MADPRVVRTLADGTPIPRVGRGFGYQPTATQRTRAAVKAIKRSTTPEMKLLTEHYDLMGADDEKRLARLDPKQHLFGCRCIRCDKDVYPCPVDECKMSSIGKVRAANHLEWHNRKDRLNIARQRRVHEQMLKPAGLEFVAKLLGDPVRASRIDVKEIRLLHERLFGGVKLRATSMRTLRARLNELLEQTAPAKTQLPLHAPTDVAIVVLRLALLSGTPPATVTAALLAWGIEKFAADVKTMRALPTPHVSGALVDPKPGPRPAQFPSADEALEA